MQATIESMMDLYQRDGNDRHSFLSDEEYRDLKARQWGANVQQKGEYGRKEHESSWFALISIRH